MNNFKPKTLFLGKNVVYLPSCHSTNDIAHEIIQNKNAFDGTIVITDNQTAGRGQRGNSWESNANQNITITIILKPKFLSPNEQFKLNIAVSNAIYKTLYEIILQTKSSNFLKIKWPNDIYLENEKLGGILIENSISGSKLNHSIIGIGLNINQLEFENPRATSLKKYLNSSELNKIEIIERLCENLEKEYFVLQKGDIQEQKKQYLETLLWLNENKEFEHNSIIFRGKIVGINELGMLGLETENGIQYFGFKEITYKFS